jgi:hypothetical protein
MFSWAAYIFELLFEIYLLIRLIKKPNQHNWSVMIIVCNLCNFGYLWTLYILSLYSIVTYIDLVSSISNRIYNITIYSINKVGKISVLYDLRYHLRTSQRLHTCLDLVEIYGECINNIFHYGVTWICQFIILPKCKDKYLQKELDLLKKEMSELCHNLYVMHVHNI